MALRGLRILSLTKHYFANSSVGFRPSTPVYLGQAWCSSSSTHTSADTPHTAQDSATFDVNQVEHLLQDDMPIDIPNPYQREKEQCLLCKYNIHLDYKNVRLLSQFVSPYTGKLYGRNITRLCKMRQAQLEKVVEKSRRSGYLAIMLKNVEFLKDPKLFDPNNPIRPHNY